MPESSGIGANGGWQPVLCRRGSDEAAGERDGFLGDSERPASILRAEELPWRTPLRLIAVVALDVDRWAERLSVLSKLLNVLRELGVRRVWEVLCVECFTQCISRPVCVRLGLIKQALTSPHFPLRAARYQRTIASAEGRGLGALQREILLRGLAYIPLLLALACPCSSVLSNRRSQRSGGCRSQYHMSPACVRRRRRPACSITVRSASKCFRAYPVGS